MMQIKMVLHASIILNRNLVDYVRFLLFRSVSEPFRYSTIQGPLASIPSRLQDLAQGQYSTNYGGGGSQVDFIGEDMEQRFVEVRSHVCTVLSSVCKRRRTTSIAFP